MDKAKKVYKISGMDCASCASLLEMDLEDAGIVSKCSYPKETLEVEKEHNFAKLKEVVEKSGFKIT
jgi:copper chaperone CopZ